MKSTAVNSKVITRKRSARRKSLGVRSKKSLQNMETERKVPSPGSVAVSAMSDIICSPKSIRRQQEPVAIMYPLKKKPRTPFYNHPISGPQDDQPLDFSTKKTTTSYHEPELRKSKSADIPSPPIADHPVQEVRNPSPEESMLNNMRFRDSSASSPDSSPMSPQSSRSVLTPTSPPSPESVLPPSSMPSSAPSLPSPNLPRIVPAGFENLQNTHPHLLLNHPAYPHPIAALLPSPYIKVDTTPAANGANHLSPIGLNSAVPIDSKFMCSPGQFSHFSTMRGGTTPESLIRLRENNVDAPVSSLHGISEKKGVKSSRPFKVFCSESLSFPFTHAMPDILPYAFTTMRDQELRYAQYAEQNFAANRRTTNGQAKHQVDVSGESTALNTSNNTNSNETDSNSNSMDSPPSNGSGQSAVTSTAPSTSEQIPKRKNRSLPEEQKDEAYWERRRKNNEAAKRSRDARRAKEEEIAMRCSFLHSENVKLRAENETLKLHLRSITGRINL